ncbi:acyltransferase family protein [Cohnella sp. JJ-181]|uniref:acyltransferase family protein n=1 Tax=Cohnella rhizoplanae TaxID=2974897 RepID=UPI0022FF9552|nr:acyltransferase [Cohnella sp. JJ-181]CAI6021520.1 hypothetical protein COHCIP112018_00331 [Cohnella sp. JJ-181]
MTKLSQKIQNVSKKEWIQISSRLAQLDAVRGLASMSVFLSHIMALPTSAVIAKLYMDTPLRIVAYGHGAVMLFFVMSGFVLSLPYLNHHAGSYPSFLIKRFCRIYIPYLAVIVVAMAMFNSSVPIQGFGAWISELSAGNFRLKSVLEHLVLLGNFDTTRYNTVIWSLVQEMRISILFPLLALIVIKFGWKSALLLCAGLSLVSSLNNWLHFEASYGYQNSFSLTLHYSAVFIIGGLLARYRHACTAFYKRLPRLVKWGALLMAMALYTYGIKAQGLAVKLKLTFMGEFVQDYMIVAGIAIFLTVALGSRKMTGFLSFKAIKFLGDISYSLSLARRFACRFHTVAGWPTVAGGDHPCRFCRDDPRILVILSLYRVARDQVGQEMGGQARDQNGDYAASHPCKTIAVMDA